MDADKLIVGIGTLVRLGEGTGSQPGPAQGELGEAPDAALAVRDGHVVAAGPRAEVEAAVSGSPEVHDVRGALVLPGWVDAHTHLVFGNTREDEFAMRVAGKTYEEIAAAGGGIHSSVRHFRATDDETLFRRASKHLDQALALGTTTLEAKSGYGLTVEDELRALRVIRRLRNTHPIDIVATFLGAHEVPQEYRDRRAEYVDLVTGTMIPRVVEEGLAEFCDVFCERGVFTPAESRQVLEAARAAGLKLKLHADEFGDTGGSRLAAELHAVSADHLHGTPADAVVALAEAGVVAVLLPGTSFFLNLPHKARAREMVEACLPVAVASDFNPGSNMSQSMPFMTTLACLQLGLQPEEALVAATLHGAAALGRADRVGRLRPGYRADFQVLDLPGPRHIPYHYGVSHVRAVFRAGTQVFGDSL